MTTKICSKCGQEYDISHFSWSIKDIKRHAKCLKCRSEERIQYYQNHKEEELVYKYERQKDRRDEARKYVWEYLSEHVCADCGEYDPLVLTFDHVRRTKKMNVSQMVKSEGYGSPKNSKIYQSLAYKKLLLESGLTNINLGLTNFNLRQSMTKWLGQEKVANPIRKL